MSDLEAVRVNIESNPDAAHEGLFALLRIRKSSTNERQPASRWLLDIVPVPKKSSATW